MLSSQVQKQEKIPKSAPNPAKATGLQIGKLKQ